MLRSPRVPASHVLDRVLVLEMVRVTEAAAVAASKWIGRGDNDAADAAAVEAMREALNELPFDGTVVIGEGERDEAPMLYIGEQVGQRRDGLPEIDIAVEPLEGTNLVAKGQATLQSLSNLDCISSRNLPGETMVIRNVTPNKPIWLQTLGYCGTGSSADTACPNRRLTPGPGGFTVNGYGDNPEGTRSASLLNF